MIAVLSLKQRVKNDLILAVFSPSLRVDEYLTLEVLIRKMQSISGLNQLYFS